MELMEAAKKKEDMGRAHWTAVQVSYTPANRTRPLGTRSQADKIALSISRAVLLTPDTLPI